MSANPPAAQPDDLTPDELLAGMNELFPDVPFDRAMAENYLAKTPAERKAYDLPLERDKPAEEAVTPSAWAKALAAAKHEAFEEGYFKAIHTLRRLMDSANDLIAYRASSDIIALQTTWMRHGRAILPATEL